MLGEYPGDITEVGVVRLSEVGGDKLLNPPPLPSGVAMDAIGVPPNPDRLRLDVGEPPPFRAE